MYEPATARFLSADPLPPDANPVVLGSPNLYKYAENDPVNRVDPSGLDSVMTNDGRNRRAIRYSGVVSARISELQLTPITLQDAIRDGQLTGEEIARLALTADEIEAILGTEFVVTLNNFEKAEQDYPNLPPAEAYMRRLAEVNYARAKLRLALRNTNLRWAVDEFYGLVRGLNPVHFVMEKGYVIGSGEEPVLQRPASRVGAAVELLAYLVTLKGLNYVFGKLRGAALEPLSPVGYTGGTTAIEFSNGGRLEIPRGVKYDPIEVENAFSEAAAGKKIALKAPPEPEPPPNPENAAPETTTTSDEAPPEAELRSELDRPTWQESEQDIGAAFENAGYKRQQAFLNGKEVNPYTKNSVRPEYYKAGESIEIKNFDLVTAKGRRSLVQRTTAQAKERVVHLPKGTIQKVIIDARGQVVSNKLQAEIISDLVNNSNGALEASNISFLLK